MQQQGMMNQGQMGMISEPPNIISTKDQLYLHDMLSWNLLAMKKAHFYAAQCQDQELKQEFDKCGQMHQRHYQQLLTHVNSQTNVRNNLQQ
ncbi:hypothetical protein [Bacillus sp. 03113]|uniref:hypothetical protein n=1 Tax=Bacillus sp. 03113 TaxID=2578211 RepID=UPI001144D876|nr:hypothetical protein [Bacillus sp. 03113]